MKKWLYLSVILITSFILACSLKTDKFTGTKNEVKIITLDPGHFHAALVQKTMYAQIDKDVHVYAPESDDVKDHLNRINAYNKRTDNPTRWNEIVYTGADYFEKMLREKKGNLVVIAGNNKRKTEYIEASVRAGLNVLADKPMAIDINAFQQLKEAFRLAKEKHVLIYDIMTERYEIATILQKELMQFSEVFGNLETGSDADPAVSMISGHFFYKFISGTALKRPAWCFDVDQQGEGIVDVTTHLVDLVQWECFPEQIIDYSKEITVDKAKRWETSLTTSEFKEITKLQEYPDYLKKYLKDSMLNVYSNGEISYTIKGVHARISVTWKYKPVEGGGDTHFSKIRGSKANLLIVQGEQESYIPTLYIEPILKTDTAIFAKNLEKAIHSLQAKYNGLGLKKHINSWEVLIPDKYKVGHESHFSQVTENFLRYLIDGKLPEWEVSGMLAKYYTTTRALELARAGR
jgi:predicted dehydrogenase